MYVCMLELTILQLLTHKFTDSSDIVTFTFQVKDLVSVVIPLREVCVVEKVENQAKNVLNNALVITTKGKMNFLFSELPDRNFLLEKLSDLLSRQPAPKRHHSDSVSSADNLMAGSYGSNKSDDSSSQIQFQPALIKIFCRRDSDEISAKETIKQHLWEVHFTEYGR